MASATSVFLTAIPIVLQARSEAQASSLCSEVGGLIVTSLVSPRRPLAETEEAVFEPGDPLFSSVRGRATDLRAVAWPGGAVTFRSCLDSTLCIGAARGNGGTYPDLSQGRSRALSIGLWRDGVVAGSCKVATGERAERISRSMRLPEEAIDNVGIEADIPIGDTVDDPVGFVRSWLERQRD